MHAHQPFTADEHLASVRQIHSLRRREIEAVIAEVCRSSKGWSIDQHYGCDGDVMLVLTPPDAGTNTTTFVLSRTATGIQLAAAEEELYEALGSFGTVAAAVQSLLATITRPELSHGRA